jgi:hypothetical protein
VRPLARRDDVVLRELPGELVVYDRQTHRAHCLNDTAARVFRAADGTRSVAQLAAELEPRLTPDEREMLVGLALRELFAAGLLVTAADDDPGSRRELLRHAAVAAGFLLPAVASVLAPAPADAASCLDSCVGTPFGQLDGQPCKCVPTATTCGSCLDDLCQSGGGC